MEKKILTCFDYLPIYFFRKNSTKWIDRWKI